MPRDVTTLIPPAESRGGLESPPDDWWVWQWIDSAFPTGGFAHSGGVEAAWQHGAIRSRDDWRGYLVASLDQAGHAILPWVSAAQRDPSRLAELDDWFDAFTTNHVANRASRAQGRALWPAACRMFGEARLKALVDCGGVGLDSPGHFAPRFGAVLGVLGLHLLKSQRLFLFAHLRGLLASGVRLGIVGPMEAQSLQFQLSVHGEDVLTRCAGLEPEDAAQTQPLHDLWQAAQDRLYSRLFQS